MSQKGQMSLIRWLMLIVCLGWSTGCQEAVSPSLREPSEESIDYVSTAELNTLLSEQSRPVLVEFCVPVGCHRCDKIRQQIDLLAESRKGLMEVYRVNLNYERSLVIQLGISVCPTYVVFHEGKEAFRISYPTSSDMLDSQLDDLLAAQ